MTCGTKITASDSNKLSIQKQRSLRTIRTLRYLDKPTSDINLAMTYRSNVDLDEEGTATLSAGGMELYHGDASISIPLPAILNIAASKTWNNMFTLEFNYARTFWSTYKTLDFEYDGTDLGSFTPVFDAPIRKDWKGTLPFQ